jgi:VanZ family protein
LTRTIARLTLWLPVVAWMVLIFALSAQPTLPRSDDPLLDLVFRKLAHFSEYAVLAALFARAVSRGTQLSARLAAHTLLFVFAYAVSDEIHQAFVPNRGPSAVDVIIDVSGGATGLALWHAGWTRRANKR